MTTKPFDIVFIRLVHQFSFRRLDCLKAILGVEVLPETVEANKVFISKVDEFLQKPLGSDQFGLFSSEAAIVLRNQFEMEDRAAHSEANNMLGVLLKNLGPGFYQVEKQAWVTLQRAVRLV